MINNFINLIIEREQNIDGKSNNNSTQTPQKPHSSGSQAKGKRSISLQKKRLELKNATSMNTSAVNTPKVFQFTPQSAQNIPNQISQRYPNTTTADSQTQYKKN